MGKDSFDIPSRIMIVGCPGAGKSTLALKLQEITDYELIILDEHYYTENWTKPSTEDWLETVNTLADRSKWIMDGNYNSSMDIRIERADMIIFLDYPTHTLLWRVFKRTLGNLGKTRPGMPAGCPERFDSTFFYYVLTFNYSRRKTLIARLERYKRAKEIHILKSLSSITKFVQAFKARFLCAQTD